MTNTPKVSLCDQGRNSFTKEDLLACSRGELFGEGNSQLPAPNMLMMDRIAKITDTDGAFGKGEIIAELDIASIYGSLIAISQVIRLCLAVWVWMQCGSWLVSSLAGKVARVKAVH